MIDYHLLLPFGFNEYPFTFYEVNRRIMQQQEQQSPRQYVQLATLGQRLQAAILDKIIFPTALLVPFILGFDLLGLNGANVDQNFTISFATQVKVSILEIVLFMALNSYLLKEYGQTLGKRIVGIAIVSQEGNKLPLKEIIGKRYLPFWLVAYLPFFGLVITVMNVLAIFRGDKRRCLHDDLAKTVVIKMPKGHRIADKPVGDSTTSGSNSNGASGSMDA